MHNSKLFYLFLFILLSTSTLFGQNAGFYVYELSISACPVKAQIPLPGNTTSKNEIKGKLGIEGMGSITISRIGEYTAPPIEPDQAKRMYESGECQVRALEEACIFYDNNSQVGWLYAKFGGVDDNVKRQANTLYLKKRQPCLNNYDLTSPPGSDNLPPYDYNCNMGLSREEPSFITLSLPCKGYSNYILGYCKVGNGKQSLFEYKDLTIAPGQKIITIDRTYFPDNDFFDKQITIFGYDFSGKREELYNHYTPTK